MVFSAALHLSDTLRIEYYYKPERQNKRLAFVFSSLGSRILNQNINGGDYLLENGFDVVNFNSSRNDWFQSVPTDVFAAIAEIDTARNYEQRVAMGSSMGGYAAIAFSEYLGCDIALAYSPQHDITIQSDPRFAGHSKTSNGDTRFRLPRSPPHADSLSFTTIRICMTKCMPKD